MTFGERLRELRHERGMKQRDLSKSLFISQRVISYYEKDERFPNDAMTLIRIGDFFDVSLDYLLGISDIRRKDALLSSDFSQDLLQLIQLYNAANEHEKGRILQFAMDLNDKDLHKK